MSSLRDDLVLSPDQDRARAALRSLETPAADPDFRARLRSEFVSGTLSEAARARVEASRERPP